MDELKSKNEAQAQEIKAQAQEIKELKDQLQRLTQSSTGMSKLK
jgi:ATP-dependent protease ClpP protease subunit